ncbi:hypothetical protein ACFL6E_02465 [Candidatus Neomarinimicrobiota bacterium]
MHCKSQRHGLTMGELCRLLHSEGGYNSPLEIMPVTDYSALEGWIMPPSPNIPGPITPLIYSGQYLFEGTNVSEGRGTTRPFELFGAPFMAQGWQGQNWPSDAGIILRPTVFVPTLHKYAGERCYGFQLHLIGKPFHSLAFTIRLLRYLSETFVEEFAWLDGPYGQGSEVTAIEILVGNGDLMDYLRGAAGYERVRGALKAGEERWMKWAQPCVQGADSLFRVALD